jgi:hypothetical protein
MVIFTVPSWQFYCRRPLLLQAYFPTGGHFLLQTATFKIVSHFLLQAAATVGHFVQAPLLIAITLVGRIFTKQ